MSDAQRIVMETMLRANQRELADMTAKQVGQAMGVCAWLSHRLGLSRREWMRACRRLWREACRA